ncbi:DinB family protein [Nonomuraea sp. NBC_01738]|uniref:DinB family protein n=1 Tax=Nonomuraea sp. NBC_01738 TaxID=2976003 RepID=UPI002E0E6786|nr:DinB family protein [Nonomuraea sp. NBC_01738]
MHAFLRYLRERVVEKAGGLSDEEARASGVASGTNLMWLVKHLAVAEMNWFTYMYSGSEVGKYGPHPLAEGDTLDSVLASYRDAAKLSDEIIAGCQDLDTLAARVWPGDPGRSMRWILVHMVEETARHAGHADILREQIDGAAGR